MALASADILDKLLRMTDEQRQEIFDDIKEQFCIWCGSDELPCHCMNDE